MEDKTAILLNNSRNFAIVKLPGRNFPGVVFQGDSLHAINARLNKIVELNIQTDLAQEEILFLYEEINAIYKYYIKWCNDNGQELPFKE